MEIKKFNESWLSGNKDEKLKEIEMKISDASISLRTFGTFTRQGAFVNGAKWAIFNLTEEEIEYLRKNGDKDKFSFIGL